MLIFSGIHILFKFILRLKQRLRGEISFAIFRLPAATRSRHRGETALKLTTFQPSRRAAHLPAVPATRRGRAQQVNKKLHSFFPGIVSPD
jgi:hypothetical protein